MSRSLLLWDIDGTLVCTGRAGEYALVLALEQLHGLELDLDQIDYRGRTDVMIAHKVLEHYGLPVKEESVRAFWGAYLWNLEAELLRRQGGAYPGVMEILNEEREDVEHALLTGNLRRGAELKLGRYELWDYFRFGAFADDSMHRNELGPVALARAAEVLGGEVAPDRVWVIGDTPHDVACGKVIGAHTIAVATGGYSLDELRACEPTAAFADLSDTAAFWTEIA